MPAIRRVVSDINPAIPVVTVETQMSQIERRFAQEKVLAQAYGLFGGIAVFVAAIGLFGLMSYNVSRRTREIGIRIAMGAQRREVLGLIVRESLVLVIAANRDRRRHLRRKRRICRLAACSAWQPTDVTTMLSAMAVMVAVSAAAGYLPARRATRVDPMIALQVRIASGQSEDCDAITTKVLTFAACATRSDAIVASRSSSLPWPGFKPALSNPLQACADIHQGRRADPLQELRQLSSSWRSRADVAAHLRAGATVREGDRKRRDESHDAAVACGRAGRHVSQRAHPVGCGTADTERVGRGRRTPGRCEGSPARAHLRRRMGAG